MIIVSQNKREIFNFEMAKNIYVETEEKSYSIQIDDNFSGKYDTEERAKEVLQEIVKTYVLTEQYKVEDERTRIKLMMEGILLYEMPKE